MKAPITNQTLFEDLVQQIEVTVNAMASKVLYTAAQIVLMAFTLIKQSITYRDGVKEWRQKRTADKTWVTFKDLFAREFREARMVPRTSQAEWYAQYCLEDGQANAAILTAMQMTQTTALGKLATETAFDCHAVTVLTITNAKLTVQMQTATATIATLQTRINRCRCATPPTRRQQTTHCERIPLDPQCERVPLDMTEYYL